MVHTKAPRPNFVLTFPINSNSHKYNKTGKKVSRLSLSRESILPLVSFFMKIVRCTFAL